MSEKKNNDWTSAVIIDDSEDEDLKEIIPVSKKKTVTKNPIIPEEIIKEIIKEKIIRKKIVQPPLKKYFDEDISIIECGIDEAGRGPMFGRVYAGLVVLPKDDSFDHLQMKDSKKFHSKNKKIIEQVAEYIKENAIAWAVEYEDEQTIDEINILQATQSAMHKCIKTVLTKIALTKIADLQQNLQLENILLLVDGNYFKPYTVLNKMKTKMETIRYQMIEGGDNKYTSIAAASILAKVARDTYINDLCALNPELIEHYGIDSNKGYGSKKHMDGIKQHGITKWHRKTFGICKEFA
jgi:ribonuclease HII